MKIGFIITVLNESRTIELLCDSIISQTKKPDEVIIVDGGSSDNTLELIKKHKINKLLNVKIFLKRGNISRCRNFAVRKSAYDIIAISDAGCVLDKNWLKHISSPFKDKSVDVVAGFYKGLPKTSFQKSLVPFVLVMPDKAKTDFLPASRSMAIRKKIFEKVGGFSEKLNQAEDYDLAKRLKKINSKIVFEKKAVVSWLPRSNIYSAFKMFYKYAYEDIKAGNLRPKVLLIFVRYLFALLTVLAARFITTDLVIFLASIYFIIYSIWSILKNYKYVKNLSAFVYLPLIQYTSDFAVMGGTLSSLAKKILNITFDFVKKEKISSIFIAVFAVLLLSVINWGLPNENHPFTYHMDEWHQLQSVRHLFTNLSPNIEGSANGPIFHFALSGVYIGLLSILGLVNPFELNSSLTNLDIQNTLFIYLRISTLLFALASVFILIYIFKKQLKVTSIYLPIVLFLFSPIWISLSNYFKYDIALIFWILLSILFIFKFRDNPTLKNYLIAVIPVSLAVTTKISALPLLIVYYLAWLIYGKNLLRNLKFPIVTTFVFGILFLILGIPDALIGTGNYFEYFHSNLIRTPPETYNYKLGSPYWLYLFTNQIPALFGFVVVLMFGASLIYFCKEIVVQGVRKIANHKNEVFLLSAILIFSMSLIPIKLFIINRSLVVLPFAVLFIGLVFQRFINTIDKGKLIIYFIISILMILHFVQGFSWVVVKYNDPREISSYWIQKNIARGKTIGIENIPIYQFLPDNVLFEYYLQEQNFNFKTELEYEIIDSKVKNLPEYIVLTNSDIGKNYLFNSPKKDLLYRMEKEGYKEVISFIINRKINQLFVTRLDFYISLLSPTPNIYVYKK